MSEIQQLIGQIPVQQVAQQAGVDEADARRAIEAIVPALVGGMQANAHDPSGAQSLAGALGQHQGRLDERLAGDVDPADGQKIVQNVFGDNTGRIAQAAGGGSALSGIIQKILPIVAPMVIAWIANRFLGQGGAQAPRGQAGGAAADSPFSEGSPGAGQRLPVPNEQGQARGESGEARAQDSGFGLDDLLGGLLGGGGASSGGGLGDLLGGLLGGGRR